MSTSRSTVNNELAEASHALSIESPASCPARVPKFVTGRVNCVIPSHFTRIDYDRDVDGSQSPCQKIGCAVRSRASRASPRWRQIASHCVLSRPASGDSLLRLSVRSDGICAGEGRSTGGHRIR